MQRRCASSDAPPELKRSLSRAQRLARREEIQKVFAEGSHRAGRYCVMWVIDGPGPRTRVGVVASKRTFRRAVDRVRAKRLLREAFRLQQHRLAGGKDIVLVARRAILGVKRPCVDKDLAALARRQGLARGEGNAHENASSHGTA